MRRIAAIWLLWLLSFTQLEAQDPDSLENARLARMISLSEVVVRTDINVPQFIDRVRNDTSFYKAFKNLRILGFTSRNDIIMTDKKGKVTATLQSTTRQLRKGDCRTMEVLSETTTGDFYDRKKEYNYYTADLYASLFFTQGSVCGENNIVAGTSFFHPKAKKVSQNIKSNSNFYSSIRANVFPAFH